MTHPRFALLMLVTATFLALTIACTDQKKHNRESAMRAFQRIEVGMSHKDGCWFAGTTCKEDKADWQYAMDVGRSFSQKEYVVTMYVRGGEVVRVDVVEPHYEGRSRQSDRGVIVAEKGQALNELIGEYAKGFTKS